MMVKITYLSKFAEAAGNVVFRARFDLEFCWHTCVFYLSVFVYFTLFIYLESH